MKKIFALALVIVMMAAISIPAFAEDPNYVSTLDATQMESATTVKYGVTQTYTVTIPSEISLNKAEDDGKKSGTGNIVVSDVCIPANAKLTLTVDSSKTANGDWVLVDVAGQAQNVVYTISGVQKQKDKGDITYASIAKKGTLLVVDSAVAFEAATTTLTFLANKTMQVANYEDKLTFSVSIG